MRLFNIFFQQRLSNFYSLSSIILFISLLFSSCSSTKEGSYAYMDDIYLDSYVNSSPLLVDEYVEDEIGEPPSNVPGAAYVYQPIPEPTLTSSVEEPYVYSPYTSVYDDFYSGEDYYSTGYYNSVYGRPLPFGVDINFLFFNALSLASYYNYGYYPTNYSGSCPASTNNNGSSSSFISKRFSWNTSPDEIIQYLGNISKNSQSNVSTTKRNASSSKSRYSSSSNSNSEKGNGFSKFISTATEILNESRSTGTSRSSDGSSGGSSGSRSGGSSKSSSTYSGKRIR